LRHPNIVKIRGVLQTDDILNPDYLFLMDRLYDTLDKRISTWNEELKRTRKLLGILRVGGARRGFDEIQIKRLTTAFDLASALGYMHKFKVIHRDITAENIGFDVRDNVKIFDFGFATSMLPSAKVKLGLYKLTARTGSFPYMAPEVAKSEPYNEKCDVYSFGILLWEMFALRVAFEEIEDKITFFSKVSEGGLRPEINQRWPENVRQLLREAFKEDTSERPSMERVSGLIQGDLDMISKNCDNNDRSKLLRELSDHSVLGGVLKRGQSKKMLSFATSGSLRQTMHT